MELTLADPESKKHYNLQGFDAAAAGADIRGNWFIIPPGVVKPDPILETSDLRQKLHKVADDAFANTGKYHYRFYAYTEANIENEPQYLAPANAGWAAGTKPGICSAFIWQMMKRNGMHLEGPTDFVQPNSLTPAQKDMGAKVDANTVDGLYLYSSAERQRAATWLHDQIHNQAQDKLDQEAGLASWIVELLTKTVVQISNEFLNGFISDRVVTADDNTGWSHPGVGHTVSPDNIMMWNGPDRGGPYGYSEPLVYREPRYDVVTVTKWHQV